MPVLISKGSHSYSSLCQRCCRRCRHWCCFVRSIFSGSCRPPPRGSLYGSWQQPQPCNHRDSCACRSIGGCHRTGCHSDSQSLEAQRWGFKARTREVVKKKPLSFHLWRPCLPPPLTCKAHPFAAHEAPVLLGFGCVTLAIFTAGRSYRSRARSSRLVYNYM